MRDRVLSTERKALTAAWWASLAILGFAIVTLGACSIGGIFPDLSAADLNKKIDEGAPLLLIDLRTKEEYQRGHIPKAVNLAPDQLHLLKNILPADKKTPVVFYCRGAG